MLLENRIKNFSHKNAMVLAHQDQVDLVLPLAFLKLESVPSDLGENLSYMQITYVTLISLLYDNTKIEP